jgi:predicted ArsR family transcriptional regulator
VSRPPARPPGRELIQRQARALGDPTRYQIFRYVAEAKAPVRVSTLVEHFQFNHNAIRQHLAKLTDALLFVEEVAPSSPAGRRPLQYRLAPTAMGSWGAPGPYELLSVLLLRLAGGGTPVEAGAEAGRSLAGAYGPDADPLAALEAEMASRGFEPRWVADPEAGEVVELVLDRCPFLAAASANPEVVCEIHRGLAEGLLEGMKADTHVLKLVAHRPEKAGCRLLIEPVPPES